MKVTLAKLKRLSACKKEITLFRRFFPQGAEVNFDNLQKAFDGGLDISWLAVEITKKEDYYLWIDFIVRKVLPVALRFAQERKYITIAQSLESFYQIVDMNSLSAAALLILLFNKSLNGELKTLFDSKIRSLVEDIICDFEIIFAFGGIQSDDIYSLVNAILMAARLDAQILQLLCDFILQNCDI